MGLRPLKVAERIGRSSAPGTLAAKAAPRGSVASSTRWPRAISACAVACAGNVCPPVPPAAMTMGRVT